MELLDQMIDEDIAKKWKYFDWTTVTIKDERLIISRTGFTNELGWEFYLRPENNAEKIGDLILKEGKKIHEFWKKQPISIIPLSAEKKKPIDKTLNTTK